MNPTPYETTGKKVDCEKHGKNISAAEYMEDHEVFIRVCFRCLAEKQTEGLVNHVRHL